MDIVIERTPPRLVSINGYTCRVWYKSHPIICNSRRAQGHKAHECRDKDKCHRCGQTGHLARHCTNSWGTRFADVQDAPSVDPSNSVYPGAGADGNANHDPGLIRAPRFLSLIQGPFFLLLMDWVLGMLIKIFLPRVSRLLRLSSIQGLLRLVMLIKTFLPRVSRSLNLN